MPNPIGRDAQGAYLSGAGPSTPTTPVDATTGAPQVDNVATITGGATPYNFVNVGAYTKQTVKAGAASLFGGVITNNSGAAIFVQIFNALIAGVTAGTTVPDLEFEVANATSLVLPLPTVGVSFPTGITLFSSTTEGGATGSAAGVKACLFYA